MNQEAGIIIIDKRNRQQSLRSAKQIEYMMGAVGKPSEETDEASETGEELEDETKAEDSCKLSILKQLKQRLANLKNGCDDEYNQLVANMKEETEQQLDINKRCRAFEINHVEELSKNEMLSIEKDFESEKLVILQNAKGNGVEGGKQTARKSCSSEGVVASTLDKCTGSHKKARRVPTSEDLDTLSAASKKRLWKKAEMVVQLPKDAINQDVKFIRSSCAQTQREGSSVARGNATAPTSKAASSSGKDSKTQKKISRSQ